MTTYVVQQRVKEMSIRKVLGASSLGIVILFSKKFLFLVGLAFVLAIPFTMGLLNYWFENFAYHISVSVDLFLLSAGLILSFVLLTMSYQALKLVFANPIDAIRNE